MTLLDRDTLLDRPELLSSDTEDEDSNDEQETSEVEQDRVEVVGEGGGRTVNGIEFEEDSTDVIKASEVIAVLSSGDTQGELYQATFLNAAIQLNSVQEEEDSLTNMIDSGRALGVFDISGLEFASDQSEAVDEEDEATVETSSDDTETAEADE